MNNQKKIQLQHTLNEIRELIREYSNSRYEQDKWLSACVSQFSIWRLELRDEVELEMAQEKIKEVKLGRKELKYLENELDVLNHRRRQMKTYLQKIKAVLNGMPLEQAEKKFKSRPHLGLETEK